MVDLRMGAAVLTVCAFEAAGVEVMVYSCHCSQRRECGTCSAEPVSHRFCFYEETDCLYRKMSRIPRLAKAC